jgi:hypothetical protein
MITRNIGKTALLIAQNAAVQRRAVAHDHSVPTPAPAPGTRRASRWRRAARAAHRVTRRETHAARIRLDPPPAATLSSPRPGPVPPRTGQRDRPDSCGSRHFRIPAALRPEWHAGAGRKGRFTQSGGGYERPGRSRVSHAGCGPSGTFSAVSPGAARSAVRRQQHRAARASPRPPPQALAGESRTGGRSLPPAIPYSFTYTCRHRNPPDPANAQAAPGINLRVNSQTIYTRTARKTIVVGVAGK